MELAAIGVQMVENRISLTRLVVDAVGDDVLHLTDAADGWPALGRLVIDGREHPVALFLGRVGRSHRNRDDIERRFQNPGSDRPIENVPGHESLLLGLWSDDFELEVRWPTLVLAEAERRVGRRTRQSIFVPIDGLVQAQESGWSTIASGSGETIQCFDARLLPAAAQIAEVGGQPDDDPRIRGIIAASGLSRDRHGPPAADRARQVVSTIVRDRRFSVDVRAAYGEECAMCGLGLGIVQGAHIYPASAPGSDDAVWNGIALCPNHHAAFDRFLIFIDPSSLRLHFHPGLADSEDGVRFVESSYHSLDRPINNRARPRADAFDARYDFYFDQYRWALE